MTFSKLPSPQKLWARHEQLVLELFTLSLQALRNMVTLPIDEDSISEALALKTREINFSLSAKGKGLQFPPDWEKPIPPKSRKDIGRSKKKKRPDFSCPFRNHSAQTHEKAYQDYHIECKRLGAPTSPNWNLNQNYVLKGIIRFSDPDYGYGQGTQSSAMIGYVQNMDMTSIIEEVNNCIKGNKKLQLPLLNFHEDGFGNQGLATASQKLKRKTDSTSSFDLRHLWIDLRR